MDFSSFIEVYYRVNKYAKAAFNQEKKDFLAKRRDCLAKGRMEEYEALVTEMSQKEEEVLNQNMMAAMDFLGYLKKDYDAMYKAFMANAATQAQLIQA